MTNQAIRPGWMATAELLLLIPASLFMTALFVRNLQPIQYEPAHTAQQIVDWYALRPFLALDVFLIAMPLLVLVTGGWTLARRWKAQDQLRRAAEQATLLLRTHSDSFLTAVATLTAAGVLGIVALHMLSD